MSKKAGVPVSGNTVRADQTTAAQGYTLAAPPSTFGIRAKDNNGPGENAVFFNPETGEALTWAADTLVIPRPNTEIIIS